MKKTVKWFALLAALGCTGVLAASPVVEGVQYPAWLERNGEKVPLTPGTQLQAYDQLRTGRNARVQLKLPEGSAVKLGANAHFTIDRVEDTSVFRAALRVLTGAFRFTTDAAFKGRPRDVRIQVKNVTAGIRGTDLWGKSTDDRDLVCLLEGKISVGAEGHPTVTLDKPNDFYQKPRHGAPVVSKVDEKQVRIWSEETEISSSGAAAREGGRWTVTAALFDARDPANALARTLRSQGYPAEMRAIDTGFAVQIAGLSGREEAHALVADIERVEGVTSPSISEVGARP
ncbi:MAG: FecR domain-containing protein [Bacillota bacterium]